MDVDGRRSVLKISDYIQLDTEIIVIFDVEGIGCAYMYDSVQDMVLDDVKSVAASLQRHMAGDSVCVKRYPELGDYYKGRRDAFEISYTMLKDALKKLG